MLSFMLWSLKTKMWNKTFFVFIFLTVFSFGFLAIADEQETITTFLEDTDQDGLTTDEEKAYGTDPSNNDTDGDSYSDGVEIESGYDPLKPAPGDRITPEETVTTSESNPNSDTEPVNLTEIATDELANLMAEKQEAQQELTNEDLNAAVANVLEQANEEIELPEIDVETVKVKEVSDKLDEEEKEAQKKEDTIEYLTTVSYIVLSNAPNPIRSDHELISFTEKAAQEVVLSIATGDHSMIDTLGTKSSAVLKEIESVEVPENMVDTHLKAMQVVKFLGSMGSKMKSVNLSNDPIGQMAELAKIQGAMLEVQNFVYESQKKLTDLGIKNIPLDI